MAWCSTRKYEELVSLYNDLVKHGVDRILTTKCVLVSADLNFGNNIHVYICTHVHTRYVCIHIYFDNPRKAFTFSFRTNNAFLIFGVNEHLLWNLSVMTTSMIKNFYLWLIQDCNSMKTEGTNLLLWTISAFWSSSMWPWPPRWAPEGREVSR